jgi:cAMP-dependent protein kinase regulator
MSDSDEDLEEEEEFVSEFSDVKKKLKEKGFRTSVSAEAYGIFNKKSQFEPKLVHKSESQKHRITERLLGSFMFQALDPKDFEIVIGAFQEVSFKYKIIEISFK